MVQTVSGLAAVGSSVGAVELSLGWRPLECLAQKLAVGRLSLCLLPLQPSTVNLAGYLATLEVVGGVLVQLNLRVFGWGQHLLHRKLRIGLAVQDRLAGCRRRLGGFVRYRLGQ